MWPPTSWQLTDTILLFVVRLAPKAGVCPGVRERGEVGVEGEGREGAKGKHAYILRCCRNSLLHCAIINDSTVHTCIEKMLLRLSNRKIKFLCIVNKSHESKHI